MEKSELAHPNNNGTVSLASRLPEGETLAVRPDEFFLRHHAAFYFAVGRKHFYAVGLERGEKLPRLRVAHRLEQGGCVHRSRPKEGIRQTSLAPEPGSSQVED